MAQKVRHLPNYQ